MTDEKKIAFIICANSDLYYEECVRYINALRVPEGYLTDVICIREANSMAQGYNCAMRESDAKYKVYLHQDVFIYHKNFIQDMLKIFRTDASIGLMGMVGSTDLPPDGFIYDAWNAGCTWACNSVSAFPVWKSAKSHTYGQKNGWQEVKAIDGMLMASQYDINWREDLALGWDFYDVSQSLEFLRGGYKIVVPCQESPWCMHDCGYSKLLHYDESRERVLKEYKEIFHGQYKPVCDLEYLSVQERIFSVLKEYLESGNFEYALEIREAVKGKKIRSNDLQYALNLLDIYVAEKNMREKESFFADIFSWNEIKDKYDIVKFTVRHIENKIDSENVRELVALMKNRLISENATKIIVAHSTIDPPEVMRRLRRLVEFDEKGELHV